MTDVEDDGPPEKFADWSRNPPPASATTPEEFHAVFEASRAAAKADRQKRWPEGVVTAATRSVVYASPPEADVTNPAVMDWLHVQQTLARYEQVSNVYEWMATTDPSFVTRLGELEHACSVAAAENRMGVKWFSNPTSYPHLKTSYLNEFGKACEQYWTQGQHQNWIEIVSIELGFKKLRFRKKGTLHDPHTKAEITVPDDGIYTFYFHEMPTILTEPWEQCLRIWNAKQVLDGTVTHAVQGRPMRPSHAYPSPRPPSKKRREAKAL